VNDIIRVQYLASQLSQETGKNAFATGDSAGDGKPLFFRNACMMPDIGQTVKRISCGIFYVGELSLEVFSVQCSIGPPTVAVRKRRAERVRGSERTILT
jgi:hypothetical protein